MTDRNRATLPFALIALAALAGCVLLDRVRTREVVFGFDHALHVEEGMDCGDCHYSVEDDDDPGLPTLPQCMLCHEEIDAERPPERRIETLFDGNKFRAAHGSALSDEVRFSHLAHATELECAACHTGIATNERVADLPLVDMDACTACHEARGESTSECATCHTRIDASWSPESHDQAWLERHGPAFRAGSDAQDARCSVCHSESTCNTCHAEVAPDNHNDYWRRRGHGITARMDRSNCATCHRTDSCARCHEENRPVNHTASFGGTRSTHCLSCHFPLRGEGCLTCHKDTPGHLMATPLPANPMHSPGQNCRQCHGITAPLPHVDKGDECIACHR